MIWLVSVVLPVQFPFWCSGFRIQCCCHCDIGHRSSLDLIPGQETSICHKYGPKKGGKTTYTKIKISLSHNQTLNPYKQLIKGKHDVLLVAATITGQMYIYSVVRTKILFFLIIEANFFFLFRAVPEAYGSSKARGQIGAAAPALHHSHRNTGSELRLQPIPQLTAMLDP